MLSGGAGWLGLGFVFGSSPGPAESPADPTPDAWEGFEDIAEEDLAEFLSHQLQLKDAQCARGDPIVAALQRCRARLESFSSAGAAKECDACPCAVGDVVWARYGDGDYYLAHIDSIDWNAGSILVSWDDGDPLHRVVRRDHVQAVNGPDGKLERPSIGSLSVASTSADLGGCLGPWSSVPSTSTSTARPSFEPGGDALAADLTSVLAFTEPFSEDSALEDAWEVEFMLRSALDKRGPLAKPSRRSELLGELSEAALPVDHRVLLGEHL